MPDTPQLLAFIAAGLLLNLTPGPDVFFIITNALRSGARAGLVASLGITAGCCVHIVAAAVGVSALVAASATAFMVLKWIGAAYLVYVGAAMLLARRPVDAPDLIAGCAQRTGDRAVFFNNLSNKPRWRERADFRTRRPRSRPAAAPQSTGAMFD